MEHFDDMLRNTLANDYSENRFEFREEYWLQAQALLEQYERKRKRRAVLWTISTLLIASGVFLYFYGGNTPVQPAVLPPAAPTILPAVKDQSMARVTPGFHQTPEQAMAEKTAGQSVAAQTVTPHLYPTNSKDNSVEFKQTAINENKYVPASAEGSSQKTALQQPPNFDTHTEVAPHFETIAPNIEQSATVDQLHLPYELPFVEAPALPMALKSISSPFIPVVAIHLPEQTKTLPDLSITKIHHQKGLKAGGMLALGLPSGFFQKEQPVYAAGVTARYTLNDLWSVNADLNWRRWKGTGVLPGNQNDGTALEDSGLFDEDIARTYSFGYTQTRTTTTLQAIHFLELPVYLERHFRQLSADAGIQLSYRLISNSAVDQYQSQSLDAVEFQSVSTSVYSIHQDKYLKLFIPGVLAGVNYQPSKHWSIGVRGAWKVAEKSYTNLYQSYIKELHTNRSLKSITSEIRFRWLF